MTALWLAVLLAPAASAEVKRSTAPLTPSDIYTAERLRDPFAMASAGGAAAGKIFNLKEDFNIHNLALRALMRGAGADQALFRDEGFGVVFILRNGRLHDAKGKPIPGVTGAINHKQKTAHLKTQDGDIQVFRLGEEVEEKLP